MFHHEQAVFVHLGRCVENSRIKRIWKLAFKKMSVFPIHPFKPIQCKKKCHYNTMKKIYLITHNELLKIYFPHFNQIVSL